MVTWNPKKEISDNRCFRRKHLPTAISSSCISSRKYSCCSILQEIISCRKLFPARYFTSLKVLPSEAPRKDGFLFWFIPASMWLYIHLFQEGVRSLGSWNQEEMYIHLVPGREEMYNHILAGMNQKRNPSEIGASEGCTFLSWNQ